MNFNTPGVYRIQLKEQLGSDWDEWFGGFALAQPAGGGTILTGMVDDQAALHGLIRKTRDLGLTLVSLQRMETQPEEPEIEGTV
ncbi:MAG: hypothetical protein E4H20_09355 [Spirochaetales bacterium]|nr:MAG: hypothetical protein E4H20_09355 [Spirochaetales bacterium]